LLDAEQHLEVYVYLSKICSETTLSLHLLTYTEDVERYGINGVSEEASVFMTHNLDAPTLNVSVSYFYDPGLYGSVANFAKQDQKLRLWMWANETYDYDYMSQEGQCQSVGVRHSSQIPLRPSINSLTEDIPMGLLFGTAALHGHYALDLDYWRYHNVVARSSYHAKAGPTHYHRHEQSCDRVSGSNVKRARSERS
jgi:hypothetical protein